MGFIEAGAAKHLAESQLADFIFSPRARFPLSPFIWRADSQSGKQGEDQPATFLSTDNDPILLLPKKHTDTIALVSNLIIPCFYMTLVGNIIQTSLKYV